MNISAEVNKCATRFEAQTGKKPGANVLCIIEATYQLGLRLGELGQIHASEGCPPIQECEIRKLTRDICDIETEKEIVRYLFECYMVGYDAEKEVREFSLLS